jgi:protein MAK11
MHYLPSDSHPSMLLVSTEDGRILVYDTTSTISTEKPDKTKEDIPAAELVAQIGGPAAGITGRIKDFEVLPAPGADKSAFIVITGSSDGTVRLWSINTGEFKDDAEEEKGSGFTASQIGSLLGTYSTGTRITCLKAFEMTGKPDEQEEEELEKSEVASGSDSDDSE